MGRKWGGRVKKFKKSFKWFVNGPQYDWERVNLFYVINKLYKNRPPRHHTDYIYIRHMCVFRWLCRKVFLTGHKTLIVLILYIYFSDYYYKRGWIFNSHDMIVSIKLTSNYFWVVYSRLIMFWYFFQGRYSLKNILLYVNIAQFECFDTPLQWRMNIMVWKWDKNILIM